MVSSPQLCGILLVDKPGLPHFEADSSDLRRLPTSHDLVQMVRRWSGQRRIGHTGTLDPMASGLLVLCLGSATRLVEYYQGHPKRYRAEVTLGTATDTYDATGQVTDRQPVPPLDTQALEGALARFRGEIDQTPPIYSALKQGGESLHRKARRGEVVEIPPRRVTIAELTLLARPSPERLLLQIDCAAGTYVRSLAHDLAQALGSCGHLSLLRREGVGSFSLEQAYSLAQVQRAAAAGLLAPLLLPLGHGLTMPTLRVDGESQRRLGYGQTVLLEGEEVPLAAGSLAQAVESQGLFLGIVRCLGPAAAQGLGLWKAEKWFG